jgi:ATP-dependent 26S proteasome regulatory subunit
VLVLVTTNEEIRTLHPAVARPGRCAANVEFLPLTRDEAAGWLRGHDVAAAVDDEATLASLYALAEGLDPDAATVEPGFAPDDGEQPAR